MMKQNATEQTVLVVGSANMDMVVATDRFPRPGETVLAREFGMYPGGKGANQAVACARLGADVTFLGKMGQDMFRERLEESLRGDGIRLDHILTDPEASTGIALITVDESGQNEIVVVSGSNMKLTPDEVDARSDLFNRAAVVMLQLEIPLETVVRSAQLAHKKGATVILNPAPAARLPDELLASVDVLTPNESETEHLTGMEVRDRDSAVRAARHLIDRGVAHVILTLGDRGAMHVTVDEARSFPAHQVEVVDTTGAGDAFNGALAYSLARGDALDEAIPFANAVAGFCVTRMGAQISMPTLEDIGSFAEEGPTSTSSGIRTSTVRS